MFINKASDGRNNVCGIRIAQLRKERGFHSECWQISYSCWDWIWIKTRFSGLRPGNGSSRS